MMRPLLWTAVLGYATVLTAPACLATPMSHVTPVPGLYRVDVDASFGAAGAQPQIRKRSDGATGNVHSEQYGDGVLRDKRTFKGTSPATQCIKSSNEGDALQLLPLLPMACKNQRMQETRDGAIVTAQCNGGLTTSTIRKLGADQWEYIIDMPAARPATGAPDVSMLIQMMQTQVNNTQAPEARAQFEKQLADLLRLQKEMAQASSAPAGKRAAAAGKAPPPVSAGAAVPMRTRSRAVLTKISNTCT